jgi:hypothetical protein
MNQAVNRKGESLYKPSDAQAYARVKAMPGSTQAQLERAMPQHDISGAACADWLAARARDPSTPNLRPVNSSDLPVIFKGKVGGKTTTLADMDVLLKYHQKRGERQAFSPLTLSIMEHGTKNEVHGCATALRFLLDGTNNWAEQVGLLRLPGELKYVHAHRMWCCTWRLVLHTCRSLLKSSALPRSLATGSAER